MTDVSSRPLRVAVPVIAFAAAAAAIEDSPIRVAGRRDGAGAAPAGCALPPGYDQRDIRVLDWIASHRRRARPGRTAN